jgi:hypothetical protein
MFLSIACRVLNSLRIFFGFDQNSDLSTVGHHGSSPRAPPDPDRVGADTRPDSGPPANSAMEIPPDPVVSKVGPGDSPTCPVSTVAKRRVTVGEAIAAHATQKSHRPLLPRDYEEEDLGADIAQPEDPYMHRYATAVQKVANHGAAARLCLESTGRFR